MEDMNRFRAPDVINRWRLPALGIGGIALLAWAVGVYMDPEQGLRSWLLGFIFWGGIAIGSLGLLMLQYLTGGAWGVVIRRGLEAASRTILRGEPSRVDGAVQHAQLGRIEVRRHNTIIHCHSPSSVDKYSQS